MKQEEVRQQGNDAEGQSGSEAKGRCGRQVMALRSEAEEKCCRREVRQKGRVADGKWQKGSEAEGK